MQTIIRKANKSGNSSAVVLPRAWLNKRVKVELVDKGSEEILKDVLDIVSDKIKLEEIIGVYLVGSYARGDYDDDSDIDVLIITKDVDRELIKEGAYEILLVSKELLYQKMDGNILPIGPMLYEAKPLLNADFLESVEIKITKKNIGWYIDTTKSALKISEKAIKIDKELGLEKIGDAVAYSLILRLRTLYIIECLKENKKLRKNEFLKLVKRVSGSIIAYERYVYSKNKSGRNKDCLPIVEAEKLIDYIDKENKGLEKWAKGRKD